MKYLKFSPIVLAAVFLIYYYFGVYDGGKQEPRSNQQVESANNLGQKQWETKSNDQPPVAIKAIPVEFGQNAKMWKFTLIFDTHTGSLDDDPVQAAVLMDDKGKTYRPVAWEGPGPGGHHREGELIFNPIQPLPEYVELKIKDVGGIAERSFKWNTK